MQKEKIIAIPIVLVGFFLMFDANYNIELGFTVFILGAIILILTTPKPEYIDDPKMLNDTAHRTPGGLFKIPLYDNMKDLHYETEGDLAFYLYIWKGERRGHVLNSLIAPGQKLIKRIYDRNVNFLSVSSMRDSYLKETYGYRNRKNIDEEKKHLEEEGYEVKYIGKHKKKAPDSNGDIYAK